MRLISAKVSDYYSNKPSLEGSNENPHYNTFLTFEICVFRRLDDAGPGEGGSV